MSTLYRIVALFGFVASMLGCNQAQSVFIERSSNGGVDELYSRVEVRRDGTHFHCIASRSGSCHYTLFAHGCDETSPCRHQALRQLTLAVGAEQVLQGLPPHLQPCVRQDAAALDARCRPLAPTT